MLTIGKEILDVLYTLVVDHLDEMNDKSIAFVNNILAEYEKGNVRALTYRQAKWLGHLSKRYIQNGEYVEHDWWTNSKKKAK